jgi:signal transduction histidine kinase
MFAITILATFDVIKNRQYLSNKPYFNSYSYKLDLREYFENVSLLSLRNGVNNNNIEDTLALQKPLRYYMKNKATGNIYTNIENVSDIDAYIKEHAINVEEFPNISLRDDYFQSMNSWFQRNNYEGKFIFIKNSGGFSQMEEDYKYYNSLKERIIKEGILGFSSFVIALSIIIVLNVKLKYRPINTFKLVKLYKKIPLDLRGLIFIIYAFFSLKYLAKTNFFYNPINTSHFFKITIVAIYAFYLIINISFCVRMIKDKEERNIQLRESLLFQIWNFTKISLRIKGIMSKIIIIFAATVLFGMFIFLGLFALLRNSENFLFISFGYTLVYVIFVPIYVLKRAASLTKIIEGTDAIASGNLDYIIEESGHGNLSRIAYNINSMKDGFKESVDNQLKSERLKTELITNVSHDLKTPLTSIINYISLLKKDEISQEQRGKYIEVLEKKSQRLKVLIEDLFEASKVSSGSVELDIEEIDIASLLRQALGEFDEKISNSSLIFRANIPVEEVYLNLDGKKTWRVFENLISNALKYSQSDSRVYIDLFEQKDKVIIIMKNMSAYEMDFDVEEIFDRFKRGDKARSTEGSGLGLSIAKSIVELQGGRMKIDIDGDLFKVIVELLK